MRTTLRLFAKVQPRRFLEAGNPTGLTGLLTHPTPRSTLLYLYTRTLERLATIPEHSVYRQSTEALTKHRYKIVESVKAPGYEEWAKRAEEKVREHQDVVKDVRSSVRWDEARPGFINDSAFVLSKQEQKEDERQVEWDGEKVTAGTLEGTRTLHERANQRFLAQEEFLTDVDEIKWEPEPPLEATQIAGIENQIGAGLIEEVIQVAEGELKLVDIMIESKIWDKPEEEAPPGQWQYFARDQDAPGTQEPANK